MSSPANAISAQSTPDRRNFLATLAAAGVLTGSAAALAAEGDEALFALGAQMEVQRDTLRICGRRTDAAYSKLEDIDPAPSDALRVMDGDFNVWPMVQTSQLLDEPSGTIYRVWMTTEAAQMFRAYLRDTASLALPLAYFRTRAAELAAGIEAFHAAIRRDEDQAGVTATNAAERAARSDLEETVRQISATRAHTFSGLLIKTRAAAFSWCDPQDVPATYIERAEHALEREKTDQATGALGTNVCKASLLLDIMSLAFPDAQVAA